MEAILAKYHDDVSQALLLQRFSTLASLESRTKSELQQCNSWTSEMQREIHQLPRKILFSWLQESNTTQKRTQAYAICQKFFENQPNWIEQFQTFRSTGTAVLVNVLTWQCEIRCTYCSIPKQSGREMSREVLEQAGELLLSAPQEQLEMRYFGGEPLLFWENIQYSVQNMWEKVQSSTRCQQKRLRFLITTNGVQLDETKIQWMSQYPISLQLALDGLPEAQNRFRPFVDTSLSSYDNCAIDKAHLLKQYNIAYTIILVIHPARVKHMVEDFQHIVDKGFTHIQINWAHNTMWHPQHVQEFAAGLYQLSGFLRKRWQQRVGPKLLNLQEKLLKVRTSREITVDWDGQVYANNSFLFRPHIMDTMRVGKLSDNTDWLHYRLDHFSFGELDQESFADAVFENNSQVGKIFSSWIRWMVEQGIPDVDSFLNA